MIYPFITDKVQANDHVFWIASCPTLKGCVGQGDTIDEAISELESNETAWIETAKEFGIPIPPIPIHRIDSDTAYYADSPTLAYA